MRAIFSRLPVTTRGIQALWQRAGLAKYRTLSSKEKQEWQKLALERAKTRIEFLKLKLEARKALSENYQKESAITNQFATIAIRNAIIINGAAAVATLTYLGNAIKNGSGSIGSMAVWGLLVFSLGVWTASMCATFAYAARTSYDGIARRPRKSIVFEACSWTFGLIALGCFPAGCLAIAISLGLHVL